MIPSCPQPDGSFSFQPSTFLLLNAIKLRDTSNCCSLEIGFLTLWLMYHEQYGLHLLIFIIFLLLINTKDLMYLLPLLSLYRY